MEMLNESKSVIERLARGTQQCNTSRTGHGKLVKIIGRELVLQQRAPQTEIGARIENQGVTYPQQVTTPKVQSRTSKEGFESPKYAEGGT